MEFCAFSTASMRFAAQNWHKASLITLSVEIYWVLSLSIDPHNLKVVVRVDGFR